MPKDIIGDRGRFGVNPTQPQAGTQAAALSSWIDGNVNTANQNLGQAIDGVFGATANYYKSRGSVRAPLNVVDGDNIMGLQGYAYSNGWFQTASIYRRVDGAVVAGQRPGSRIDFETNAPNTAPYVGVQFFPGNNGVVVYVTDAAGGAPDKNRNLHVYKAVGGFSPVKLEHAAGGASNNVLVLKGGDNAVTGSKLLSVVRPDDTEIGSIQQNAAGTVVYNTSSDRRLKENIQDSAVGLAEVKRIRVREFNYRTDARKAKIVGFIAQELANVFPDAVTKGSGDTETADCACDLTKGGHVETCCHANPWGVDYGRLSPLLVRAIQELAARVEALEAAG